MPYYVSVLFSFSIALGAILGWIRLKKLDPAFFPFILLLTVGLINEVVSVVVLEAGSSNALSYNIYSLVEVLLICWQFQRWKLFAARKVLFIGALGFCVVVWVIDIFIINSIFRFSSYSIILHSFVIVVMSIHMINHLIFKEIVSFMRHPVFLICLGFIIYFTYAILVEMFWVLGLNRSGSFRAKIYEILAYINLITNLIYALAVLWMPMKPRYIMLY